MSIVLFGATGDLGSRVARHLNDLGADVRYVVRKGSAARLKEVWPAATGQVVEVDDRSSSSLEEACRGGSVVISTVSGLEPVVLDFQTRLIRAAAAVGVPRFIPSDFAVDYRKVPAEENRNLSLLERFRQVADGVPGIQVTSVMNGAFMDMLTGVAPFILYPMNRILCWGDRDQKMDFTTIDDTARYTAYAALDPSTPRYLYVAGDELSANDLAKVMTELTGKTHRVFQPGGLGMFKGMIAMTKFFSPGVGKKYPPWQGMQYMHSMYSGLCKFERLDNQRYPMKFTDARTYLKGFLDGQVPKYQLKG
jgi:nucleoside-diphosphate-sugar epimerase